MTVTTVNANMVMDPPANTGSATEKEEEEEWDPFQHFIFFFYGVF